MSRRRNRNGARPASPITAEVASRANDPQFYSQLVGLLPNIDQVLQRANIGDVYAIYDRMLGDAHLAAQADVRQAPILSLEWRLEARDPNSPADVRAAELCEANLKALKMRTLVESIHGAVFKGFSVVELMWASVDGQWLIDKAELRPQRRFQFDASDHQLRVVTRDHQHDGELLPEHKVVLTQHKPTSDWPQGVALLGRCFWPWTFKTGGWRFWVTFAERFGFPWVHANMPAGTSDGARKDMAGKLAKAVQDAVLVTIGASSLTFHEAAKAASSDLFRAIIQECNADISKALVGQTLTAEVGDKGSYAAAQVHDNVRGDLVDADKALVAESIEQQILAPLTLLNIEGADPPVFTFVEEDAPRAAWSKYIQDVQGAGLQVPRLWAHQKLNIPVPEDGEDVLTPGKAAPTPAADFAAPSFDAQAGVAFCDELVEASVAPIASELRGVRELAVLSVEQSGDLTGLAVIIASDVTSDLERSVAEAMLAARMEALTHGEREARATFQDFAVDARPVRFEEAERALSSRIAMTRSEFDALTEDVKARAFTVATIAAAEEVADIQQQLVTGMAEGQALSPMIKGLPLEARHAEVVVRNAVQSAYMAGRFQSAIKVARVRPYFQYQTAGDNRVRDSHAALDGKVFRLDDPSVGSVWPPCGHQCRCTVITLSERQLKERQETRPGLQLNDDDGETRTRAATYRVESAAQNRPMGSEGFASHPLAVWKPDLTRLPPMVRQAVADRAKARWERDGRQGELPAFMARHGLSDLDPLVGGDT